MSPCHHSYIYPTEKYWYCDWVEVSKSEKIIRLYGWWVDDLRIYDPDGVRADPHITGLLWSVLLYSGQTRILC